MLFTFSNAASSTSGASYSWRDEMIVTAFAHRSEGESNVAEHLACGRGIRVKKAVDEDQLHAVLNVLRHATIGQHCPSKSRSCIGRGSRTGVLNCKERRIPEAR